MKYILLILALIVLAMLNLVCGSVDIPLAEVFQSLTLKGTGSVADYIVLNSRLPMAVTAILAGASLAAAGLLLQTAFRNRLAGPDILGINSGASLGVALVMLGLGGGVEIGSFSLGGYAAVLAGALAGALLIMALLLMLANVLRNGLMLLICGIMTGYLASSGIMMLNAGASADTLQSYVVWGMSSFNSVALSRLPVFAILCAVGLALAAVLVKPLDILLLGEDYARNLGVNLRLTRNLLLLSTGILAATVTAFCGPVSFIGLAVPHITRLIFPTDSHRVLLPAVLLTGAVVALGCNLLTTLPSGGVLPLNAVTPLVGAPVVIWILFRHRK